MQLRRKCATSFTWYQAHDETNEDPASDERGQPFGCATPCSRFDEAFAGKWNWVNQPKAFDQMAAELVTRAGGRRCAGPLLKWAAGR
ncbi:MAG: hypothetical protein R2854_29360 [Caldilineaceae bacterium]